MTSFRNPCNTIRHCSSYELTHPSQVTTCRVACAGRPSRAAAVMGKCLSPFLCWASRGLGPCVVVAAEDLSILCVWAARALLAWPTKQGSTKKTCLPTGVYHVRPEGNSLAVWHYAVLYAFAVAIRRFVNEPTLIYGVLCDRPSTPFSNWQELRAWAWLPLLLPRHAPSRPGTCSSNIDSADAVFRKLLYYYYVVPIAWGRQRIEWELWLKGARHAGSPETMLCNSARCSVPKYTCSTL